MENRNLFVLVNFLYANAFTMLVISVYHIYHLFVLLNYQVSPQQPCWQTKGLLEYVKDDSDKLYGKLCSISSLLINNI